MADVEEARFADALRAFLQEKRWTVKQFAAQNGWSWATVYRWLACTSQATPSNRLHLREKYPRLREILDGVGSEK